MFNECTRREIEALIDAAKWTVLKSSTHGKHDQGTEVLGIYLTKRGSEEPNVTIYEKTSRGLSMGIGFTQQAADGKRHFLWDWIGDSLIYKAAIADRRRRREALILNGSCGPATKSTTTRRL